MTVKIAINGMGSIGIGILRSVIKDNEYIEITAVNSDVSPEVCAHQIKYDSVYGVYEGEVSYTDKSIVVDGKEIHYFQEKDLINLPWMDLGIDIVVDSSKMGGPYRHIEAGTKHVILTYPSNDAYTAIVMGVNEMMYNPEKHKIISTLPSTVNCVAPILKAVHKRFHIMKANITDIHSNSETPDKLGNDLTMLNDNSISIIYDATSTAKSIGMILPELQGKLNVSSLKVPTPAVSLVELNVIVCKQTNVVEINEYLKEMANNTLKGILSYSLKPSVSIDFKGDSHSAIIDSLSTIVTDGNMVKILAWYDNEYGYVNRIIDLIKYIEFTANNLPGMAYKI
ncbi:MAG: glyceraldehyde 3-phosphate dehydrogenase NAD-binding domain-containing protein [Thermoanaerobacteraceae bacterium]|nr:glyceraldehyde 3-phosphate dehydrogenase NAD-binding domain-containing protein [Thermoanaerobacteraceae bacterium]